MWSPSAEEWGRIEPLVDQLLTMPPSERAQFVNEHLSSSQDLKRWVERLVQGADDPAWPSAISPALVSAAFRAVPTEPSVDVGSQVGPFRIVREIGRGGMGRVFEAERPLGTFAQRVALKVVPSAIESEAHRRRFQIEQRLLARLEHPNVARLVDAGVRADGLPWFAMEYIDGVRIDHWCDAKRLGVEARLRLFLSVCEAVQAAHQRLVIHRDLKPSNIFVAEDGTVRLLDFGVATLLEPDSNGPTEVTRPEERMFTPEYAAPEQWRLEPATTATDCYALGVVLYQLLAGRRPFQLEGRPRTEWSRIVAEEEPSRPSSAVSAEAALARHTTIARLARHLRGDLDAIVLKALRADPARRYPTARELADEVRRHLEGDPVSAREGRWAYQAGRFLRRNRVGVLATTAVLVTAIGGAAVAAWQASRARRAAAEATAVTRFLTGLFEQGSPLEARGDSLTAGDMLLRASRGVDSMFPDQPGPRFQVLLTIAGINRDLGRLDQADTLARKAFAVADSVRPGGVEALMALGLVGGIASARDQLPEADSLLRGALALARSIDAPDSIRAELLDTHASVFFRMDRFAEAEAADREALRLGRNLGPVFRGLVTANIAMAVSAQTQEVAHDASREAEADSLYRLTLDIYRTAGLVGHPDYLGALSNLATLMLDRSRPDSARPIFEEALVGLERIYPPDHERVISAVNNLAAANLELENAASAESGFVRARSNAVMLHGPRHFLALIPWYNIGKAQLLAGPAGRAETTFRGVLGQLETREGIDGRLAIGAWLGLGRSLAAQRRFDQALAAIDSASALGPLLTANSTLSSEADVDRATVLIGLGRSAEAERLARQALAWRRANLQPRGKALADAVFTLARAIMAGERTPARRQEGIGLAEEAAALVRAVPWLTSERTAIDAALTQWRQGR